MSIKIESSSFGRMVIAGKTYTSDVILFPDGNVIDSWRRKRGHELAYDDISDLVASAPDVIVAGTGVNGLMKPEAGLRENLLEKGIELISLPNPEALQVFNKTASKKRVAACFHLTC